MSSPSARCPFGHYVKPGRDYVCGDCREHVGPCRCQLFRHVMADNPKHRKGKPTPILGGGFRVTYHPERLAR